MSLLAGKRLLARCLDLADAATTEAFAARIPLARTARRFARRAGLPLPKQVIVMRGAPYNPGLFAEFASVLGLLDHYEHWNDIYAGVSVDFGDRGLYFEPGAGRNWWAYYFLPIDTDRSGAHPSRDVGSEEQARFAKVAERRMSRRRGYELITRHIGLQPAIRALVESFAREQFRDAYAIGVHYRGTDKWIEDPRVPFESVHAAINAAASRLGTRRYVIFVATDEQGFLDAMREAYPGRVRSCDAIRSRDGAPVHTAQGNAYRKGRESVVDCLLLSRCDLLIRTPSNLGLCATFFNPDVPEVLLVR
jgi:hypothetical protein